MYNINNTFLYQALTNTLFCIFNFYYVKIVFIFFKNYKHRKSAYIFIRTRVSQKKSDRLVNEF